MSAREDTVDADLIGLRDAILRTSISGPHDAETERLLEDVELQMQFNQHSQLEDSVNTLETGFAKVSEERRAVVTAAIVAPGAELLMGGEIHNAQAVGLEYSVDNPESKYVEVAQALGESTLRTAGSINAYVLAPGAKNSEKIIGSTATGVKINVGEGAAGLSDELSAKPILHQQKLTAAQQKLVVDSSVPINLFSYGERGFSVTAFSGDDFSGAHIHDVQVIGAQQFILPSPTVSLVMQTLQQGKPVDWNVPRQDNVFVGREGLLESLHAQLLFVQGKGKTSTTLKTLAITACAGLGGIGKTQLALRYMHTTTHSYTLKAWISAENIDALNQSYLELAEQLNYRDEKPSPEAAKTYLKNWFVVNPGWLLVFDNVSCYEELESFLPKSGGSIIITTRQQSWPDRGFTIVPVDVMTEKESIELITKIVEKKRKIKENEKEPLQLLVKILGHLPLALAQAAAYMREKNKTISAYVELYQKEEEDMLADGMLPTGTNHVAVAVTWNTSLTAIETELQKKKMPSLARILITACSYFASDKIPVAVLRRWFEKAYPDIKSERVFDELIFQLQRYSLITQETRTQCLSIHRLMQSVLRHQHQRLKSSSSIYPILTPEWYETLFAAADEEFGHETQILEDEARRRNLIPHLQSLINHYDVLYKNPKPCLRLGNVLSDIARETLYLGDAAQAKALYARALAIQECFYGKEHIELASTLGNVGNAYLTLGDAAQAKGLYERALSIQECFYGKEHIELASTLVNLGNAYLTLANAAQAKVLYARALAIQECSYDEENIVLAVTLMSLGNAYWGLGDAAQAKVLYERAFAIKKRFPGKEHIQVVINLVSLGNAYATLGDPAEVKALCALGLEIQEYSYGKDHIQVSVTLVGLGNTYLTLGDAVEAKALYERALAIQEPFYGKEHIRVATTLVGLGTTYLTLGDAVKAKALYERALAIQEPFYGKEHIELTSTFVNLGNAYLTLGDAAQAKGLYERALAIQEPFYGKEHIRVTTTLVNLGKAYQDLGDAAQAKGLYERAPAIQKSFDSGHSQSAVLESVKAATGSESPNLLLAFSPQSNALSGKAAVNDTQSSADAKSINHSKPSGKK